MVKNNPTFIKTMRLKVEEKIGYSYLHLKRLFIFTIWPDFVNNTDYTEEICVMFIKE